MPSSAPPPAAHLVDLSDAVGVGDNADFWAEAVKRVRDLSRTPEGEGLFDPGAIASVVLLGEYGVQGVAIRGAQSLLRRDRTASYWNHCFVVVDPLVDEPTSLRDAHASPWAWESTIEPPLPSNRFTPRNGVAARRVRDYARAEWSLDELHCVPNVCLIAVGMTAAERRAVVERATNPDVAHMRYDVPGLVGTWLSFVRKRVAQPNPLSLGHAVYCSAFVQLAFDAAGIDLAPGADEKNTAPEHFWQTAKWLSDRLPPVEVDGRFRPRPLHAFHYVRDKHCRLSPD